MRKIKRPKSIEVVEVRPGLFHAQTTVSAHGITVTAILAHGATSAEALAGVSPTWRTCCSIGLVKRTR